VNGGGGGACDGHYLYDVSPLMLSSSLSRKTPMYDADEVSPPSPSGVGPGWCVRRCPRPAPTDPPPEAPPPFGARPARGRRAAHRCHRHHHHHHPHGARTPRRAGAESPPPPPPAPPGHHHHHHHPAPTHARPWCPSPRRRTSRRRASPTARGYSSRRTRGRAGPRGWCWWGRGAWCSSALPPGT
jgi:hypothetical protein